MMRTLWSQGLGQQRKNGGNQGCHQRLKTGVTSSSSWISLLAGDGTATETSEILVSREFSKIFFHFHFLFSISSRFNFTFTSQKRVKGFIFHFSLLEKSESYPYFTLFSREKRVKSGAGYNLTSIFVPNCISKNCQISSKHQPQNIGQISISKS